MPAPIIIPIPMERTRNCIERDGRVYCEKAPDLSGRELGVGILLILLALAWVMGWIWWGTEGDHNPFVALTACVSPLIIVALYLIL